MSFQRAEQPVVLKGKEAARAFLAPCLLGERYGTWWVAHVDEQVRCIHLARYDCDGAEPHEGPPEAAILGDAVRLGSAGLVLASATSSLDRGIDAERRMTRRLACAAEPLDVTLVDHLLFAQGSCLSMRSAGLL